MKTGSIALSHKVGAILLKASSIVTVALKPFGIWGLGGLAFIDSGFFPLPTTMDGAVIGYVAADHGKFLLYCLMAAAASALGCLLPYYLGRAGGEMFLLKRINRARYEQMRDRFANQEFLAILIPAMMPPPMPVKLFVFAAGVFEMKPLRFAMAVFTGKLVQFLVFALITIFFGPEIAHGARNAVHEHLGAVLGIAGAVVLGLSIYVLRKLFDRRRGTRFPLEEAVETDDAAVDDDSMPMS